MFTNCMLLTQQQIIIIKFVRLKSYVHFYYSRKIKIKPLPLYCSRVNYK